MGKLKSSPDMPVKERIKNIQQALGIEADGIVGPETLTKIEDLINSSDNTKEVVSSYSLTVSRMGLDQLIQFEISSENYYEQKLSRPTWPGGASGITIGIGYDLGYNTKTVIQSDWKGLITETDLEKLIESSGEKGENAKALVAKLKNIKINLESAKEVFYKKTLPRFAKDTVATYPGANNLPADAQSMLLSLIYNRGTSLSGNKRTEMKAIQALVQSNDLIGIANQIRLMKRLWDPQKLPGLLIRRDKEAEMIENANRNYLPDELIRL